METTQLLGKSSFVVVRVVAVSKRVGGNEECNKSMQDVVNFLVAKWRAVSSTGCLDLE